MLLGLTFLLIQIIEYLRIGFSPRDLAFGSTFFGLTGLHGLHVFVGLVLLIDGVLRVRRGVTTRRSTHLGVEVPGDLLALRRRHVDRRLRDRLRDLGVDR